MVEQVGVDRRGPNIPPKQFLHCRDVVSVLKKVVAEERQKVWQLVCLSI